MFSYIFPRLVCLRVIVIVLYTDMPKDDLYYPVPSQGSRQPLRTIDPCPQLLTDTAYSRCLSPARAPRPRPGPSEAPVAVTTAVAAALTDAALVSSGLGLREVKKAAIPSPLDAANAVVPSRSALHPPLLFMQWLSPRDVRYRPSIYCVRRTAPGGISGVT